MLKSHTWLVAGCLIAALAIGVPPASAQGPKAIELPVLPKQLGKSVRVTFRVEFASPTTGSTVNLHSMKEWTDPKSLWVVLTPEALQAYRKLGVTDAVSHFAGKTIQVEGTVILAGLVKAVDKKKEKKLLAIIVTDPAQIQIAKIRPKSPNLQTWMKEVAALPAKKQLEAVARKLKELNPGFDGKIGSSDRGEAVVIENGRITELRIFSDMLTDIAPIRALADLKKLVIADDNGDFNGQLTDLSPLQGMRLTSLDVHGQHHLSDLSPLRGMPLTNLNVWLTRVSDLTPLRGMPLTTLNLSTTPVVDLSPLAGMPLTSLNCTAAHGIVDLSPLRGMRLKTLWTNELKTPDLAVLRGMPLEFLEANRMPEVSDLSPLVGMPLRQLEIVGCPKITDLSPIRGLPLRILRCDVRSQRDAKLIRSMTTLEQINERPAAEFRK